MKESQYFWWHGKDLKEFFDQVNSAGYDNVRIEIHEEGKEAFLKVIDKRTRGHMGTYNYSHTCPPDCDDD